MPGIFSAVLLAHAFVSLNHGTPADNDFDEDENKFDDDSYSRMP
jgi:hypothetical protein